MEKLILILLFVVAGCADEKAAGPVVGRGGFDAGGFDLAPSPDLLSVAVDALAVPFDLAPVADAVGSIGVCPEGSLESFGQTDCNFRVPYGDGGGKPCIRIGATRSGESIPDPVFDPCARWMSTSPGEPVRFVHVLVMSCAQCAGVRL